MNDIKKRLYIRRIQIESQNYAIQINKSGNEIDKRAIHFSRQLKLRNLNEERMHRKASSTTKLMSSDGDTEEDLFSKHKTHENLKLLSLEQKWNHIKHNLSNITENNTYEQFNSEHKYTSSNNSRSYRNVSQNQLSFSNIKAGESDDEISIDEGNENANIHRVKLFKTSKSCNSSNQKHYIRVVPVTKISLQTNGIYINSRTNQNLYSIAKLASDSMEQQKFFSYSGEKDSADSPMDHANTPNRFTLTSKHTLNTSKSLLRDNISLKSHRQHKAVNGSPLREDKIILNNSEFYKQLLLNGLRKAKYE